MADDCASSRASLRAATPNDRHVAYAAGKGAKQLVVADGQEGAEYDKIVALTVTPQNTLEYLAISSDSLYRVNVILRP
jgi:hypothetical protein